MLGFSSSRPNWDPPLSILLVPGGGALSLAGEGGWGSQFGRGSDTVVLQVYMYFVAYALQNVFELKEYYRVLHIL